MSRLKRKRARAVVSRKRKLRPKVSLYLQRSREDIQKGRLLRPAGRTGKTSKRLKVQLLDAQGNPLTREKARAGQVTIHGLHWRRRKSGILTPPPGALRNFAITPGFMGKTSGGGGVGPGEPDSSLVTTWQSLGFGVQTSGFTLSTTVGVRETFDAYASVSAMRDANTYSTYGLHSQPRSDGPNCSFSLVPGRLGGQAFRFTYTPTGGQLPPSLTLPWRQGHLDDAFFWPLTSYALNGSTSFVVRWWWRLSADIVAGGWWKWMMMWYHEPNHSNGNLTRSESGFYQSRLNYNHGIFDTSTAGIPAYQAIRPYPTDYINTGWVRQTNLFRGNTVYVETDPTQPSSRDSRAAIWLGGYRIQDHHQSNVNANPVQPNDWGSPTQTYWTTQMYVDLCPDRRIDYIRFPGDMLSVVNAGTLDIDDVEVFLVDE